MQKAKPRLKLVSSLYNLFLEKKCRPMLFDHGIDLYNFCSHICKPEFRPGPILSRPRPKSFLRKGSCLEQVCRYTTNDKMIQVLNVAEKNDAAKNLANILSRGGFTREEGFSKFNKIYKFDMVIGGERCHMVMTSVSGHLLNHSFTGSYKKWYGCSPLELFDAPVVKICPENMHPIKRTLESKARNADRLIIWTDCDREGENIGFEIISVCKAVKPSLEVLRAKFSEITVQSVNRAIQNLDLPDQRQNDAVEVRSELDLRIGASFTRFQTLRLQKVFPQALADILISYGSCQFPTLGFVVERFKAIQNFIPEEFWKIKVSHEYENSVVEFLWKRVRLFNQLPCQVLLDKCLEEPIATVRSVKSRPKSKWRPQPLDTIELEKLASRKLRINAKEAMKIAEKLYTNGLISYPRTETNIFPPSLDLVSLIEMQTQDANWGVFANNILQNGPMPRQGKKSDQAHPPIHPTKYIANLQGNEQKVYEFIVRHFLACCSKDAKGTETIVEIIISGEEFTASGLIILERNYLDVYPYDRWSDKEMPNYQQGQNFEPTSIEMFSGQTSPPPLLTEADLIALMEKHGIGTDATHADHIETIKSRQYVGLQDQKFVPGKLGIGLVEGYDAMGFEMSKPHLRAELEADLKRICEGTKNPDDVLRVQVSSYKEVFREALKQASKIDEALARFLDEAPQMLPNGYMPNLIQNELVVKCCNCNSPIVIKKKKDGSAFYLSCSGYPECKASLWFPESIVNVQVMQEKCSQCAGSPQKLKFVFSPHYYHPHLPDEYTSCIGGCDMQFLNILGLEPFPKPKQRNQGPPVGLAISRDSGYSSNSSRSMLMNNNTNRTEVTANNRSGNIPSFSMPLSRSTALNPRVPSCRNINDDPGSFNGISNSQSSGHSQNINPPRYNAGSNSSSGNSHYNLSQSSTRPSWLNDNDSEDANAILCSCNQNALKLTVRKEGPNTGRQFFKCLKPHGEGCNFFLWADNADGNETNNSSIDRSGGSNSQRSGGGNVGTIPNGRIDFGATSRFDNRGGAGSRSNSFRDQYSDNENEDSDKVNCNCDAPAKKLTTQKEGPNKGRQFYTCFKMREEQCGFFKWADEVDNGSTQRNHDANNSLRGSGREKWKTRGSGRSKPTGNEASTKRKCGVCGEVGHNRSNCPQS